MGINNFVVFNDNVRLETIERLNQRIDLFNNSQGMITLSTVEREGDFFEAAQFDIADAHDTIDIYDTNADRSDTEINMIKQVDPKVQWVYGPVVWRGAEMAWINQSESVALDIVAGRMTNLTFLKMLNNSVAAAVAAYEANTDVVNDVSALGTPQNISQEALNNTYGLMGDRQNEIVGNLMSAASYNKLIGQALANDNHLFTSMNVTVIDIQGKASVVADIPALSPTGKNKILGMKEGAINCYDGGKLITNLEVSNGKNMIKSSFQANGNYMINLMGYSWDEANGGKSPLDAELATGTNWDEYLNYDKNTGGVLLIGDSTVA